MLYGQVAPDPGLPSEFLAWPALDVAVDRRGVEPRGVERRGVERRGVERRRVW